MTNQKIGVGILASYFLSLTFSNAAFSADTDGKSLREWAGEWRRNDQNQPSTLTISDVTPQGFKFLIDASTGVNVGSVDGKAKFDKDQHTARAEISTESPKDEVTTDDKKRVPCKLTFSRPSLQNSPQLSTETKPPPPAVEVTTDGGCSWFGGTGVTFDGTYITDRIRPTFKPGFDCTGTISKVEKAICESSILSAADREMSKLYHAQESDDPFGKDDVALKKAQKAWLRSRDGECSGAKEKMLECLVVKYRQRIGKLRQSAEQKGPPPSTLRFTDFIKATIDESRDTLWNDVYVDLYLFEYLGEENHTAFRDHFVRYADTSEKKPQALSELDVFATIQGDSKEAGVIITSGGCLWAALPVLEKDKFKPLVYAPKTAAKVPPEKYPEALKIWLENATGNNWHKPDFKFVFPQKC